MPHHPDLVGVTLHHSDLPVVPLHHLDLPGGTSGTSQVLPHHPDLAGVLLPPSRPGWGTPYHHPDLTGVPLHHPDLAGVPPQPSRPGCGTNPSSMCELTNKLKTVPSPILRMRAVISCIVTNRNKKKDLLREHKRRTACCVASACSAVLSGGRGVPTLDVGYLPWTGVG